MISALPLTGSAAQRTPRCGYLLFVDDKAAGVIEAKKTGAMLSGVDEHGHRETRWGSDAGKAVSIRSTSNSATK